MIRVTLVLGVKMGVNGVRTQKFCCLRDFSFWGSQREDYKPKIIALLKNTDQTHFYTVLQNVMAAIAIPHTWRQLADFVFTVYSLIDYIFITA